MMMAYSEAFPMTPFGGIFLIAAGLSIMLGAVFPRHRIHLIWLGFAVGTFAITVTQGFISKGLHATTIFQLSCLIAAVLFEFIALASLMPRARRQGERDTVILTLFVVSLHFIIMLPAFGVLIGALAFCCVANASACKWVPAYSIFRAWLVDGALKAGVGVAMLLTAPIFGLARY